MNLVIEPSKPKPTTASISIEGYPLEVSTSSINRSSDMSGYFSFQHLNYEPNMVISENIPNASICFTPTSNSSQIMSDTNNSGITSTMLHSVSTSIFQTPTNVKPTVSISSDGVQNWEASNNNFSSNINNTNNSTLPLQEEMKWCEYLNTPFLMQNQQPSQPQSIYNEVKPETGFITDESCGTSWHHQQNQQQPQQAFQLSDIYSKDLLQRFSVAFGQTL